MNAPSQIIQRRLLRGLHLRSAIGPLAISVAEIESDHLAMAWRTIFRRFWKLTGLC